MEAMQPPGDLERFRQTLQELSCDLGPDGLAEVLASYLADGRRRVEALTEFLEDGDLEGLGHCAHALKGSSSIFGLIELERAALAVEMASCPPGDAGLGALIERLRSCYTALEPMLRAECPAPLPDHRRPE